MEKTSRTTKQSKKTSSWTRCNCRKGYRTPAEIRGYTLEGFLPVRVSSEKDIQKLTKENAAIISAGVGNRKKVILIKKLAEKGIKILNLKNPQEELKKIQTELENRKKETQLKAKAREKKKEAKEEKNKKEEKPLAEKVEQENTESNKAEQEKKELDKLLTKAQ